MAKLISDIKFEGTNEYIVWKSPIEDFETGSVLTVFESQTALFYLNGAFVGELGAGRHILETDNIPFLSNLYSKVTGDNNIFHSQIYFVNKVEMLSAYWGVGNITYQDISGIVFKIGCSGEINFTAQNPRTIVEKMSGMAATLMRESLIQKFQRYIGIEVTNVFVNTLVDKKIPITNIYANLKNLSEGIKPYIDKLFKGYGFSVPKFAVINVALPTDDPQYKRLIDLKANQGILLRELELQRQAEILMAQTKAQKEILEAQAYAQKIRLEAEAMAFKRNQEGYTYQQERQFDVMKSAVENEGNNVSGISNELMQMGIGFGVMGTVGDMFKNNIKGFSKSCSKCGSPVGESDIYCSKCGTKIIKEA